MQTSPMKKIRMIIAIIVAPMGSIFTPNTYIHVLSQYHSVAIFLLSLIKLRHEIKKNHKHDVNQETVAFTL